jgi:DNA-binding GntR family transcriptional regulator
MSRTKRVGRGNLLEIEPEIMQRPAILRESLFEAAVARVRDMIIEGELAPGARLQERALCDLLHVSRTPLREALRVLAAEGLVELLPSRRAVVRRMSIAEVLNTFEVIGVLEALAGKLAASRIAESELARIVELHLKCASMPATFPATTS